MEILIDNNADVNKYTVKIYLFSDFQDINETEYPKSVLDLFSKKLQQKESDYIWVETVEELHFFVKTSKAIDFESIDAVRQNGSKIYTASKSAKTEQVILSNKTATPSNAFAFVEGFVLSSYNFDKYKSEKSKDAFSSVVCKGDFTEKITQLHELSNAVFAARNFINEPACSFTSEIFAQEIVSLFKQTKAQVTVYDKAWIESQKMGGLLAVNKGSIDPPRFVHIVWNPKNDNGQPIVLVGKGIVYDTGGLSLKTPSSYMETMKADMGGAAAIVGALKAIVANNVQVYVEALIPITDNRLSGNSYAPGDVVTMHSGTTVEVLNTDAEGRMILADALSYAKTLNPKLVIDVATLTGAANAAVGEHAAVFMGTADAEMQQLENTSLQVWEPVVKFPIWNYYAELIKSDIADIKNVGGAFAGSITAGKFLQKFVDYPWIHIDISGSAFLRTKSTYKGVGGTGFGVRMLFEFLRKIE